jgi:hypothetical protein
LLESLSVSSERVVPEAVDLGLDSYLSAVPG